MIKVTGACTLSREPYPFPDIWDPLARVFDAWGLDRCLWATLHPWVADQLVVLISEPNSRGILLRHSADGVSTLSGVADELNRRGILTATGKGEWRAHQVRRVLMRLTGAIL